MPSDFSADGTDLFDGMDWLDWATGPKPLFLKLTGPRLFMWPLLWAHIRSISPSPSFYSRSFLCSSGRQKPWLVIHGKPKKNVDGVHENSSSDFTDSSDRNQKLATGERQEHNAKGQHFERVACTQPFTGQPATAKHQARHDTA